MEMKKKELLVPVGSMEAMYQAVHNGADAIYLAGKSYGARAYAQNFTDEELEMVVKYAHFYNVKVHVTVNTLIKNNEFMDVTRYVQFLYSIGVDAIIVQDVGLIDYIHQTLPDMEIHASTQMHNLNSETCEFLSKLGCKRVVLAREVSLNEINDIKTDLDLEIFIHGSLCVSYSGECLLSSIVLGRSGNRGECAQLCRTPFKFIGNKKVEGKYFLSTKDLCTALSFDEIMKSKAVSLKIEGRMKSPQYVGLVTKIYRKLIDAYYENKDVDVSLELDNLKHLFNRGFTRGHLFEDDIMNRERPNHQGVKVGEVIDINHKYITIKLCDSLRIKDGIKFPKSDLGLIVYNMYKDKILVHEALSGEVVSIENNVHLKEAEEVLKTKDSYLEDNLSELSYVKVKVDMLFKGAYGCNAELTLSDGKNIVNVSGDIVEKAINRNVSEEDIKKNLLKVGNTGFTVNNLKIEIDENIFMRLGSINEMRREALDKLKVLRESSERKFVLGNYQSKVCKRMDEGFSFYINNEEQLLKLKQYKLYTSNWDLYKKYKDKCKIYYEVSINNEKNLDNERLLVNNTRDLEKYKNNDIELNYGMNVFNKYTLNYYRDYLVTLSPELKFENLASFPNLDNACILIYGSIRLMTIKNNENFNGKLIDKVDRHFKVISDNGIMYLYDERNKDIIEKINYLKSLGIKNFRLDLLGETSDDIDKLLVKINEYE